MAYARQGTRSACGRGVNASVRVYIEEVDLINTGIVVKANMQFTGRLAELGQPLIERKADAMVEDFANNFIREISKNADPIVCDDLWSKT